MFERHVRLLNIFPERSEAYKNNHYIFIIDYQSVA